jgi:hypothetical protein
MGSDEIQEFEKKIGDINIHWWCRKGNIENSYSIKIFYKDSLIYEKNAAEDDTERILVLTKNMSIGEKTKYSTDFFSNSINYINEVTKLYNENHVNMYCILKAIAITYFPEINKCLINDIKKSKGHINRSEDQNKPSRNGWVKSENHRPEYINSLIDKGLLLKDGKKVTKSLNQVALELQKLRIVPTVKLLQETFLKRDGTEYTKKTCEKAVHYANST